MKLRQIIENSDSTQRVFFVDLDETLIKTKQSIDGENYHAMVLSRIERGSFRRTITKDKMKLLEDSPIITVGEQEFTIMPRPHLHEFMTSLAAKGDVHILTASHPAYADAIVDALEIPVNRAFSTRDYRQNSYSDDPELWNRDEDSIITKELGVEEAELILFDDLSPGMSGLETKLTMLGPNSRSIMVTLWQGYIDGDLQDSGLLNALSEI